MAKSAKSVSVVEGTSMDKLVKEGKALASIWNQTNSLKNSTKPNGFDTRLGKLLVELKAQSTLDTGRLQGLFRAPDVRPGHPAAFRAPPDRLRRRLG